MVERDTFVTIADGDQLNDGYFNGILGIVTIADIDTTADVSGGVEPSAVSAASIGTANYLIVKMTGQALVALNAVSKNGVVSLKLEIKEVGGAYGTAYDKIVCNAKTGTADATSGSASFYTVEYVHTLTAGQKSNGVQIKVTSTSSTGAGITASYTNAQIVQSLSA